MSSLGPPGYRQHHMYNSRLHQPNDTFNFWQDISINLNQKNNWEQRSICVQNEEKSFTAFSQRKRSAGVEDSSSVIVQSVNQVKRIPDKHKARYVYS